MRIFNVTGRTLTAAEILDLRSQFDEEREAHRRTLIDSFGEERGAAFAQSIRETRHYAALCSLGHDGGVCLVGATRKNGGATRFSGYPIVEV